MKVFSIIAFVAATSAIRLSETPMEVGVPNTPGPLFALKRTVYSTAPIGGNKATHASWPPASTTPLVTSTRFGGHDNVNTFTFDTSKPRDAKYQE